MLTNLAAIPIAELRVFIEELDKLCTEPVANRRAKVVGQMEDPLPSKIKLAALKQARDPPAFWKLFDERTEQRALIQGLLGHGPSLDGADGAAAEDSLSGRPLRGGARYLHEM